MGIVIRKAKVKDVPSIKKIDTFREILARCSPLDRLGPKSKPPKGARSFYENFIYGKDKWCYVAEKDNRILGFILFYIEKRERWWEVKYAGYIDLIIIDKHARGKGISKLLLKKAYEIFRKKKLKYVRLSVQTGNKKAYAVWKKLGFKEHRVDMWRRL